MVKRQAKTGDLKRIVVYMPPFLVARLSTEAQRRGISTSALVVERLAPGPSLAAPPAVAATQFVSLASTMTELWNERAKQARCLHPRAERVPTSTGRNRCARCGTLLP